MEGPSTIAPSDVENFRKAAEQSWRSSTMISPWPSASIVSQLLAPWPGPKTS